MRDVEATHQSGSKRRDALVGDCFAVEAGHVQRAAVRREDPKRRLVAGVFEQAGDELPVLVHQIERPVMCLCTQRTRSSFSLVGLLLMLTSAPTIALTSGSCHRHRRTNLDFDTARSHLPAFRTEAR